ncbi:hypothetical protein ACPTGZ_13535, partial [Enterococcus faecium]|uniref:hypothetical protein n=1 Tax=Enterococcus faecium TaxID=1352 RepID=UPI003CC6A58F
RVQEIFEARNPKGQPLITEETADDIDNSEDPATRTKEVTIKGKTDTRRYSVPFTGRMKVAEGDMIHRGAALTEGSI